MHASDSDDEQQQCPLCFEEMQAGRFEFAIHVARHLEEISLAALRAAFDTESDVESTTDSYIGDADIDVERTTHADIAHASSTVADDPAGSPDFSSDFPDIPDALPDTNITGKGDVLLKPPSSIMHEEGAASPRMLICQDWAQKASAAKRKEEEKAEESREDAKRVRKIGACVRCHMYKLKVYDSER